MPVQMGVEWLSIVPIAESRSSYNGLLVFVFIAASGMIAAFAIHRMTWFGKEMVSLMFVLPLALPGIVSSLLLTFIVSFDDFIIAFFLCGTDTTLPVYIWAELRFPYKLPGVLALGSTILLASAALVVLAEWVRRLGVSGPERDRPLGA